MFNYFETLLVFNKLRQNKWLCYYSTKIFLRVLRFFSRPVFSRHLQSSSKVDMTHVLKFFAGNALINIPVILSFCRTFLISLDYRIMYFVLFGAIILLPDYLLLAIWLIRIKTFKKIKSTLFRKFVK